MNYVDGFMAPVALANKQQYLEHARESVALFKEFGALRVVECWGDDVPNGDVTSMPLAVQAQEGEVVVFSWVVWPSKEARDKGMEKLFNDPRMQQMEMPFDGQRLIYGGFQVILDE